MGKGVIVEHLGDAHYRIGLDIDVSYARDQLAAINLYLDEFAPKYAEATQAKNDAQAALTPINDRLTVYLADAQSASQAAYDAMVAAYDEWLYAVEHQPDPGGADFLLDALSDAKAEFDAAHDQYIMALDGDPQAELTPEEALTDRTNALALLSVAMSDFQNGVGPLLDETAVNDALDLLGVALSDFENATVDYAADPGNPTLKSAMNYYRSVYDSAHSDWVSAVNNNSGDALVQAKRNAYDTAAETFDTARENLGSLLGNGGMPAELAAIMADQERAWATYHGALQNWQSLTLIKVEKESARAELMSRLLPYTDPNGDPIRQTVNAWCCDLTEDMSVGAEVATIEIPGERDQAVRVRPGYESRETYSAARDGLLQPSWASSPEATYWNWALHPGNARWNPNYRLGEILFVDQDANTCTVQLDPQRNNEKSRARDGNTLDVINPVKYAIDPTTGAQTSSTPGDNVMVEAGVTTLTDVPIEYMECNAAVFEVGDHVMVEFQNRAWTQPKVIGFAENPKSCNVHGLILTGNVATEETFTQEGLFLKDTPYGSAGVFNHPTGTGGTLQGGNVDWVSADGKNVLTWKGPMGRAIAPRWLSWSAGFIAAPDIDTGSYYSHVKLNMPVSDVDFSGNRVTTATRFGSDVYLNGRLLGTVPDATPYVLGAAIVTYSGAEEDGTAINKSYVVAACSGRYAATTSHPTGAYVIVTPAMRTHSYIWAQLPARGTLIAKEDWQIAGTQDFDDDPEVLPPATPYHFSASGLKCASCVPRGASTKAGDYNSDRLMPLGNDVIVRGEVTPTADGILVVSTLTRQDHGTGVWGIDYSGTGPVDSDTGGTFHSELTSTRTESSSAIVAVDFVGETEVTLSATRTRYFTEITIKDGYQRGYPDYTGDQTGVLTTNYSDSETVILTDDYRAIEVGRYTRRDLRSGTLSYVEMFGTDEQATSIQADCYQPMYYDIRYGSVVTEHSQVSISRSTLVEWSVMDRTTSSTWSDTWSLDVGDIHAGVHVSESANLSKSAVTTSTQEPTYISVEPGSSSLSGTYDPTGASQMSRSPWWCSPDIYTVDDTNFTKLSVPVWNILHCNQSGDVVGNINLAYNVRPSCNNLFMNDWGYFDALNVPSFPVHAVFASGFDIDAAWQNHLDAKHRTEGQPPIVMTALDADLKPEFRR